MNLAMAIDLSVESHFAVRWALALRDHARARGEPVQCSAIHVPSQTDPFSRQTFSGFARAVEDPDIHRKLVHRVRTFLESVTHEVDDVEIVIKDGRAAHEISRYCVEREIDWLVTGMSTMGPVGRFFLGSTVHQLADHAPCKIAVVHPEHARLEDETDIVVGVDFLPGSDAAIFAASELATYTGGHLYLVHAMTNAPTGASQGSGLITYLEPQEIGHLTAGARTALDRIMEEVRQQYPEVQYATLIDTGAARHVLTETVKRRGSDLLVMGKVHHPALERWALGSVSRRMLKRMPTTMIFAPPEAR